MLVLKEQGPGSEQSLGTDTEKVILQLDEDLRSALSKVSARLEKVQMGEQESTGTRDRHETAVEMLEAAAARRSLKGLVAIQQSTSKPSKERAPLSEITVQTCESVGNLAASIVPTPAQATAAQAVRSRYHSITFSHINGEDEFSSNDVATNPAPLCRIPVAKPHLIPPARPTTSWKPPAIPVAKKQPEQQACKPTINVMSCPSEDAESLPGSPFWTETMNISDQPDGETSEYKDAEMKRMLRAWLMPRRTTKWCTGSCTLEQKVEQKRSRMVGRRTPMFMMNCT